MKSRYWVVEVFLGFGGRWVAAPVYSPLIGIPLQTIHKDITKVQLDEPVFLIGVIYRTMGERLLTGTGMAQSQLYHQVHLSLYGRQLAKLGARNILHTACGQ